MTAWISSPLSSAIRATIRTLDSLLDAIPHPGRTWTPLRRRRHCTASSPAASSSSSRPFFRFFQPEPSGLDQHQYNRLMKALSHSGDVDGVLRVLRHMKQTGCAPNVQCYTTAMKALASAHCELEARAVFKEMLHSGVAPDLAACTLLLKVYSCHLRRFHSAHGVMRWMAKCGCDLDVVAYTTLITGLCRAGRVEDALQVIDRMLEMKCAPNVHTYSPILQAYCSRGMTEDAKKQMELMRVAGCPPDTVVYNILIQGLCNIANFDEAASIIEESYQNGWEPDAVTYGTYIAGLCKLGKAEEAFRQLVMPEKGLRPNTVGLNILLNCLGQKFGVLLELCAEQGFEVDIVGYNTVMSQLCKLGRWHTVVKIFSNLLKKGMQPDTWTFNILIHSLCKAGKFGMADLKLVFNSKAFVADIVTCNILLHEFIEAGKEREKELQFLLFEMHARKLADTVTLNTWVDCLCRNGKSSDAINLVADIVTCKIFIHEFYVAGKANELGFLVSVMHARKFAPYMMTLKTWVDCLCRNGKSSNAINSVIKDGYLPAPVARLTYWIVRIGNLGEVKLGDLWRFIEVMLANKLVMDSQIFHHLIKAFCRKGSCQTDATNVCFALDKMLGTG